MRSSAALVLMVLALITAVVSLFADDSYGRLVSMQKGVAHQVHTNAKLDEQVQALKRQVGGLQNDPRVVEKAARSGLGMARADEVVVIFEHKTGEPGSSGNPASTVPANVAAPSPIAASK